MRQQILPALISIIAEQQPQEALRMAGELSGEHRRTALAALFLEWSASHPRAAAEAALALTDSREQNLALRQVLGKWMDRDVSAAISWAKALPPEPALAFSASGRVEQDLALVIDQWNARDAVGLAGQLVTGAARGQRNASSRYGDLDHDGSGGGGALADDGRPRRGPRSLLSGDQPKNGS